MPAHYSNSAYTNDRYSHHAEHNATMHAYSNRQQAPPRPDFARSQTMPRGPLPAPPHGPMYPADHSYPTERAYPAHHAPHPTYTRQHHSYYDERGPLPPPPLHHRHAPHPQDAHYGYAGARSPPAIHAAQSYAPYAYGYHAHSQHPGHAAHARHLHPSHHASSASSSMHAMRASIAHPISMPTGSQQQPTYRGHIKTTKDAILLLAACDLVDDAGAPGLPPPRRVNRRLLDSERADLICSGSIFVWDEKEAGMRRWTDGKCWSASRVSGCFLTYRELEARKKPSSSITGGPTSNLYKADGLIKQSFSMTTTSGRKLHVISYYTKRDVREGLLRRVSEDPRFVGENGGEWGLEIDEAEYPDPISRAGDLPPGVNPDDFDEGSASPPSPAHREPVDLRASHGEPSVHSRENSFHARKMSPSPRAYADERAAMDRGRISPGSRDPHHLSPRESSSRRGPDSHMSPYSAIKTETADRLPYAAEVTPLHEARGLLPIRPIPVDSKYAELAVRRNSKDATLEAPGSAGLLYSRKRSYQDFRGAPSFEDDTKPVRPRLQRMRSSSMSDPHSSAQDMLAPIRPLGRVSSDDEGVSKLRSTHSGPLGFKEQHDSAVGALLSLRSGSGSSDDSLPSNTTPPTSAPSNSPEDELVKPAFSRMDRAALDRFSVRI
ncbi:Gluconate transport inducer 1/Pac2 [Kalmanozyma brasiliensis GHG001]|uniref:cAMP-independent regulatory protein pac2 n=1 Tax=Kalmanozyma brasiliensis (strain GHG001) TaxID=1365824 RepID=V5GHL7_KALBG|nr:Gluconate transport inducer 1/Pac2 [Kalmanozyma brasiliensis GHG001]EST05502.1 Gluconate transport inducer 1/Pac2 [Kalmanozyma brasiliensis GHG001]